MVLDTSAVFAILADEPERRRFVEAIEAGGTRLMSAATLVELSIVIESRYGAAGLRDLDLFLDRARVEFVPVDMEQASAASRAFSLYGKGRHPAALNFGDCLAYALAKVKDEPLFFKGHDFARTDILGCLSGEQGPVSAA